MKNNQPVTNNQVQMTEGDLLVSKTNLKGTITYLNDAFIDISGYPESELIGQSHNIVRHPDMPAEAFKDLWDTVQAGRPWAGVVKNRCKNGDYYWVKANVMPMLENGKVSEYMSVRTKPTADEIRNADELYSRMRAGSYRVPLTEKWNGFTGGFGIRKALTASALLYVSFLAVIGYLLNTSADTSVLNAVLVIAGVVVLASGAWLARHVVKPMEYASGKLQSMVEGDYFSWVDSKRKDEAGMLLDTIYTAQIKLGFEALQAKKQAAIDGRIKSALDAVSTSVMLADKYNNITYINDSALSLFRNVEDTLMESIPGFSGADALLGSNIDDFHKNPEYQQNMLEHLSSTHKSELEVAGVIFQFVATPVFSDEERIGTAVEWLDLTAERKAEQEEQARVDIERKAAAENGRIRTALDHASSSVMIVDTDNNIIYMNNQVKYLFENNEAAIREDLPNFSADQLMGANIDQFHKTPGHQQRLVKEMQSTVEAEFVLGGRTLAFVANPVVSEDGDRVGTAVEWQDRTDERAIEHEIENIVVSARSGDLKKRIDMAGKTGFNHELSMGFNSLMNEMERVFSDLDGALQRMSSGDLTLPITSSYDGTFSDVKNNVNDTMHSLGSMMNEMREIADSVATASNEINSGNTSLSSRTEQQAANLEETAASMEEINSTVAHNAENSQQANQVANTARMKAEEGGEVVGRAVVAMNEINDASSKIAEIIGVIDEIAFQTNLLALNASVEAARAGEQGRGFAVVATEVRNLAGRSATAAKEIKELIQDSVDKVQAGSMLVNESGGMLKEIVTGVKQVGDIIAEIAAAGQEQAEGLAQISHAVTALDETTQQNAALAEEISANSASLADYSVTLEEMIGRFNAFEGDDMEWAKAVGSGPSEQLDFYGARTAHLAWRQRIRDFLDGKESLNQAEAVSHRDCKLGKWLYGGAMEQHGHVNDMQVMEKEHEKMHSTIREIIALKEQGDTAHAELKYGDVASLSDEIVGLLKKVEHKLA